MAKLLNGFMVIFLVISNCFLIFNLKEQFNFILYGLIGKEVKEIKNISTSIFHLKRDNLTSGMYFYKLLNKKEIIAAGKIIVN